MQSGALARRYAQALFEIARETSLDQIDRELTELTQFIQEQEGVQQVLYHPHISLTEKKALMDKLLVGQLSDVMRHFLYLLIDRRRQNFLPLIRREFSHLADEARQIIEAKVATAVTLTPNQTERLKAELSRMTGKSVRLVSELRPELVGGVLVQVGDRVMDGTIKHALERMKLELRRNTSAEPQGIGVK
ncbi:MAG: F0F1 ATP synthase subunit delta [Desulfitobacteriaceae bacterium]|nr:F0F1 ATP synthase subunit delta [Desulfitobacteriaceae bacterium]MDI6880427.1 F0F1 ATP synthase subunit delta [Desulfitobacteriaceae bacterium]MDI6915775.1 F0F1 ATP synthase subunit delta [Desulfitobacteriaceae bacterium]